jgi:[ribosomal protein S18]-alanine N-acetyltransferase
MTLRRATVADLDAIMALERASFPTDAWSPAMMREELSSPHGWYVVDEAAGRLVGYAGLRAVQNAKDADVQTIAIAEAGRGRGRGRSLLRALLEEAARRGIDEVFLEVRADNPVAHALYASEGFLEIARKPRYYQPDDVDAVVMKLDLGGWSTRPQARVSETEPIRKPENRTLFGSDRPTGPETEAMSEYRIGGRSPETEAMSELRIGGRAAHANASGDAAGGWCT